jgi:hypothetical protein
MLAAIVPAGDRAWFLKASGPIATMDKLADAITEFYGSLGVTADQAKPTWKLPEGWTETPGSGMRAATLTIPTDDQAVEISVIALPWRGAPDELLSNINRWRGQMKLPEAGPNQLAEFTREIKVGDATMTIVDLQGQFSAGSMAAPFAGSMPSNGEAPHAGSTAPSGEAAPSDGLPAGHPPIASQPTAEAVPFTFTAHESWHVLPAGGLRKLVFAVTEGPQQAFITAIDFPSDAGPMISDPLENVNRWRHEVGLAEISKEAIGDVVQTIEMDGVQASYAEMIPEAAQSGEPPTDLATIAAMVQRGEQIWFFKLSGSRELVVAQRDNFKTFLESVKFTTGGRENDAN